ncbi:hemin uptake protein HemP [Aestuariispira insulae]|uniref:Hemin uptake protein hemP n=1 Tax=Aestuariispira insulae TaxID=1461337 RepID=A0A3D9H3U0_9PROT|nr:hemin uptake protein HemP [Aestuariispira insulae]RED44167.1 hemin uptake protein hemP [Aestuariispira insulae]
MGTEKEPVLTKNSDKTPDILKSEDLFQGARELIIRHRDKDYRLRITSLDKLILTK